jgi:hypothetical protein
MRPRTVLALGLMLTLASAGCARGTDNGTGVATAITGVPKASSSPTATAVNDADAAIKFAQCMRQQGLTWFPDPDANGRVSINVPQGTDPKKVDAARKACKKYAPAGPADGKPDPQAIEQARQMAKCMRANGVPNFPDPNADGSIAIDGSKLGAGPGDPTFDKAQAACSKYMPPGADQHTVKNGSGQQNAGSVTGGQG